MLDVALKEWSIICDLLLEGELAILLRKGGIHEYRGPGRFELEYERFALFPAWEHQMPERIKPRYRDRVEEFEAEPETITFKGFAEVEPRCIWQVPGREAFDQLQDLHPWMPAQIDMRFNYKPERPLYLIALRAYRLAQPVTVPNRDAYAGCKSWVPLKAQDAVDDRQATPTLDDEAFKRVIARVNEALNRRAEEDQPQINMDERG